MIYLLVLFCVLEKQVQTDWMGGSGVQGPVPVWYTRYYQGDSVTVATEGQVSLIATQWDYNGWIRHTVESNPGIQECAQGLMPADIDNDGIKDLVAHTNDTVVWYKHNGTYNFTKNVIGPAVFGGASGLTAPCVFPCDLDKNGNIDVLVATPGKVLGWFENNLPGAWTYNPIDTSRAYHRVSAADIDLDGDMDVIAADNSSSGFVGVIRIFKNDGSQNFVLNDSIKDFNGWRVYAVDFNKDGYPDLYSVFGETYIYLNDGYSNPGHFTLAFDTSLWSNSDFDGAWPSDINMDGSMDLVCASINIADSAFYAFLGDGTGSKFTPTKLTGGMRPYIDGSIARDIDLDSLPDIAGTWSSVGWFRQTGNLTFTLYNIDNFSGSQVAHWIYAASIGNKCIPSIDLLVTKQGEHIVYENNTIQKFANPGYLTSSVLELADTTKSLMYFGWNACVPGDSSLAFWWRSDTIAGDITGKPWNGPYFATKNIDSIKMPTNPCAQYFQYRTGLWQQNVPADISVLYEAWISYDSCQPAAVEEKEITKPLSLLKIIGNQVLLSPNKKFNDVTLSIYNTAGELVQTLYKGPVEAKSYKFVPLLKTKGVYLVTLKYSGRTETEKLVKSK